MEKNKSTHSITVNVKRPRTFAKATASDLKKNNTENNVSNKVIRKPSEDTLRFFSLPDNTPLRIRALNGEDVTLLPYKLFAKKQEFNRRELRKAIKVYEKYKITSTDLRNRLHVPPDPLEDIKTVTDVDDCYFKYLKSNPTSHYTPVFKSLLFEFHDRLRVRQEIGYRQDEVMNIEQHYRRELLIYEQSVQRYTNQVKQLNVFVAEDYHRSMEILRKCEALTTKLNRELSIRENLASKQFTIQSRLIGLDYLYFVQQKYGRFLYYLSPPSWRGKHREFAHSVEIEAKGFDLGSSSEEDTFNVVFHNMQSECCYGLVKPVLYFSHPDMLMDMFDGIAKQHLHHFIQPLAPCAKNLDKSIAQLKRNIEKDTAWVALLIKDFLHYVRFCEERETQLQAKFMTILKGLFYDTVAATDILKLKLHLEFCYKELCREESFNMNTVLTAKALEKMYMDYSYKLDGFTNQKVKMALKRCIAKEDKKLRQAHIASRELRLFDKLERSLLKAHDKPLKALSDGTTRHKAMRCCNLKTYNGTVKQRSISIQPTKRYRQSANHKVSSQPYSLTEAEIEYLHIFTEWTNNEDPGKYLHSLYITDR